MILGLDLSLTASGVATLRFEGGTVRASTAVLGRPGRKAEPLDQMLARLDTLTAEIMCVISGWPPELAVVEDFLSAAHGGKVLERAYLWLDVVKRLRRLDVPVASVNVRTLKKWATGSGSHIEKTAVVAAMARMWPDADVNNDGAADALALASMGAQRLGWPLPTLARHRDALRVVEWPDSLEDPDA